MVFFSCIDLLVQILVSYTGLGNSSEVYGQIAEEGGKTLTQRSAVVSLPRSFFVILFSSGVSSYF